MMLLPWMMICCLGYTRVWVGHHRATIKAFCELLRLRIICCSGWYLHVIPISSYHRCRTPLALSTSTKAQVVIVCLFHWLFLPSSGSSTGCLFYQLSLPLSVSSIICLFHWPSLLRQFSPS